MGPKYIVVMTLTFLGHVTSSVTWPFESQWSFPVGGPLDPSVYLHSFAKYLVLSILESWPWPFWVTWRHRSRDHSNPNGSFPISGSLDPSLYLHPFSKYFALSILGSRPWPFVITRRHPSRDHWNPRQSFSIGTFWHQVRISNRCVDNGQKIYWGHDLDISGSHQSRDHSNRNGSFFICGPFYPSLYLDPFSKFFALSILRSRPWPYLVTWRHRSRDHSNPRQSLLIGTTLASSPYLQPLSR